LIVVVMGKRLEQQNTVETLNSDRDALKKEGRFFVLSYYYYYQFLRGGKVLQSSHGLGGNMHVTFTD